MSHTEEEDFLALLRELLDMGYPRHEVQSIASAMRWVRDEQGERS